MDATEIQVHGSYVEGFLSPQEQGVNLIKYVR